MSGVNKAIILGRLGKDPEIRMTQGGDKIASITLATSFKTKGEETTEWHRISLFKQHAELVEQYCKKGDMLYVEGRIQTRKWTDKDGQEKYSTEIVGSSVSLLGGKKDESREAKQSTPAQEQPFDDEIPF